MKASRKTKRALIPSILAVIMCVAMLIGTTFAWFTDTASTSVNKIQAGTLDVALEMKNPDYGVADKETTNQEWINAEGKTLEFVKAADAPDNETVLWEPGVTYTLPELRIVNNGNLALKYKVLFNAVDTNTENLKLAEVINVTMKIGDENAKSVGTLASVLENAANTNDPDGYAWGALEANANSGAISLKFTMDTAAGNEYQGKTIEKIAVTVLAKQDTVEYDSTTNQYDKNAAYPVVSNEELEAAASEANSVVSVTSGTFNLPNTIAAGVSIAGDGADKTVLNAPATQSGTNTTGLVVNSAGVTISDATISTPETITQTEYQGIIDIREGGATLDGVTINNSNSYASSVVVNNGVGTGETVTLKNTTLNGGWKPLHIVDGANGTVVIENCEITGTYTFNVNSNTSQNLVIECKNSKLHGWTSYGNIKSASFVNTEFTKGTSNYNFLRPYADTTLNRCTFGAGFKLGAGATGKTYTITDCTYDGTELTAENVETLLLAQSDDDRPNLAGCTIIVNGKTVTVTSTT